MLIHEHACVAIRKDMPLDRAALIGCGVTTGVGAVIHTANVRPGETVAVIGCGGVGLAAINGAAIAGAGRIIAIDTSPAKDNMARNFGATDFIDASKEDPVAKVMELTGGGVHHSFEAIGLGKTAEQAFNMLRRGGTANIIGMIPVGQTVTLMGAAFLGEKRIQGSLMGSNRFPVDMPRLRRLLHVRQAEARRDDLAPHQARGRQRGLRGDEDRPDRPLGDHLRRLSTREGPKDAHPRAR